MNTARVFLVAALVAVAYCADMTFSPAGFAGTDSAAQWQALQITNTAGVTLSAVSFTVSSPGVSITYPGAGSSATVGTINNGATGTGSFNTLAGTGNYNLNFNVLYKKSGVSRSLQVSIQFAVTNGDGGATGKREILDITTQEVEPLDEALLERSEIAGRDFYVNINTNGVTAEDAQPTWNAISISTGTVACNSVTYTVIDQSQATYISYPYGSGNSLGNIANNSTKYANFQSQSACGYYNLNVTISYKLQGTSTTRRTWKIVLLAVTGPGCEGGDSLGKRAEMIRSGDASATGYQSTRIPVEYAVAVGLAGVALVAVFSVVGTMFFMRRRSQENVVA